MVKKIVQRCYEKKDSAEKFWAIPRKTFVAQSSKVPGLQLTLRVLSLIFSFKIIFI